MEINIKLLPLEESYNQSSFCYSNEQNHPDNRTGKLRSSLPMTTSQSPASSPYNQHITSRCVCSLC